MAATALIVTALLASSPVAPTVDSNAPERADVGFEELATNRPEAAIEKIGNGTHTSRDPAALINLGNAHARLGETEQALEYYRRAIESDMRYDLELADGSWMDSRHAAQKARDALLKRSVQAMRH